MIIAKNDQLLIKVSTWEDWVQARTLRKQNDHPKDYMLPQTDDEKTESAWWSETIDAGRGSSYSIYATDKPEGALMGLIKTFNHNEAVKGMETAIEIFDNHISATSSLELFLKHIRENTHYRQLLTLVHPANEARIGQYESLGWDKLGEDTDLEDDSKIFIKLGYIINRQSHK